MANIQEMTQLSPTMAEGTIVKWLKKEGDSISPGDILAEVETDKAVMEMEAYDSGVLLKIIHLEGAKLRVGEALAIVGKPGEDITEILNNLPKPSVNPAPAETNVTQSEKKITQESKVNPETPTVEKTSPPSPLPPVQRETTPNLSQSQEEVPNKPTDPKKRGVLRVLASPLAKSVAIEQGVDLHSVIGTGPEGRITKKDVLDMLSGGKSASGGSASSFSQSKTDEVVSLNGMRKTIAKRLTESKQNIPHFYLNLDIKAKALEEFRSELLNFQKETFPDADGKVSINDIIVKAVAVSLRLHPKVNASFMGDSITQFGRVDVGIAVSLEGGLLTPVVRNADQKSILTISSEIKALAKKARDRKLKPEEFSKGTFTISNLGMFGISRFTAIINEPESAILAVGAVEDRPVVEKGQIVPGRMMSLTLSCDHRVVDGAVGAEFLRTLKSLLEKPSNLAGV